MATNSNGTDVSLSCTENWIKSAKIAVAMAIIKSKPDGVSARDYAEQLSSQYRKRPENQSKLNELQSEVNLLKRQLETMKTLQPFDTTESRESILPTPPENTQKSDEDTTIDLESKSILYSSFLMKISTLKSIVNSEKRARLSPVLRDTTIDFLRKLLEIFTPKLDRTISVAMVTDSITTLVKALESGILKSEDLLRVQEYVKNFATELWTYVLKQDPMLDECMDKEFTMNILVILGCCLNLQRPIITATLHLVSNYCDSLRSLDTPLHLNIVYHENSVYLLEAMERILKRSEYVDLELLETWKDIVETSALHLSFNYPLIASTLCGLAGLLEVRLRR